MLGINLNPLNCNVDVKWCLSGLWASRRLGRPKSAIKKLKKEMEILEAKRDDIKNQIKEAEREGKIPTKEVSKWVRDVEILEGKVADIEQDFQTMRCCSCSCFNQIGGTSSQTQEAGDQVPIREPSNYCSIILRVVDKLEEVNRLMSRDGERNLIATDPSRLEFGIQKLEKEMARLRAKRDDIKNEITEKEREGKIPTNQVSRWLLEVETLEGQVIDIKLDFQSISCFSCNNCFNQIGGKLSQTQQAGDQVPFIESSNCCSINRRATEKLGETNDLMSRAGALDPIATDLSRLESGIQKLEKEMARLRAKRDDIKNEITEKEREGKIPTNQVSRWLLEVETLEGQVTDIKLDFQSISCFSCNNCFNQTGGKSSQTQQAGDQVPFIESSNCCSINRRATEKLGETNDLMSRAGALDPIATDLSRLESGIQKLEKEMARLRAKRDDIKIEITKAERRGKIPTNQVSRWLLEVETLEGQVTVIKLDFQSISCFNCNNCFNQIGGTSSQTQQTGDQVPVRESSNCCSINRRATEKLGEANELMSRASELDQIVTVGPPEPTAMLPISYQPLVGIDSYVEDIVGYIDGGGEGNIIGIHGMGGIGKTTILKSIQQHYFPKHTRFDRVIWVVASKDHQLKKLQMDIAEQLGLNTLQENDDNKTCGKKLFNYLNSRNCLLLLDDIWEHVDLQMLGMAHSATKQGQQQQQSYKVVVFTTRSEIVCAQMKAKKEIKVKCLDPVQAWQLFEENSNKDVLNSAARIKFVAEELAKECAGLPLALVTVARAMLGKKSWEAWKEALRQIRDKHDCRTIGLPEDSRIMYKAFKLSYDSLENDCIRECLLCCALWPEDYEIDKFSELIPCWIGCGIICFNVINEAFAIGCSYSEALIAASLLEKYSGKDYPYIDTCLKMHDVIRDMALLMFSGLEGNKRKWIVKAGIGLSDLPRKEEWHEAERASFMRNEINSLQEYEASTFSKLSMLILHRNRGLKLIPQSLFASMPHLTYLDLAFCDIKELPMEIGSLIELQYLNLSFNHIKRLPPEFGCLCKLEYLLLMGNDLQFIPNGTISNLLMLKWLDIRKNYSTREWWWDELKCFKRCHQLSVGISIYATTDNIERLNMLPPNVIIWELTLNGKNISKLPNYNLGTPQWGCRVTDHLETMVIEDLRLDRLVLAACVGRESSFKCLKSLHFEKLALLEEISLNRVRLCNLRELHIYDCCMLKDVSWVLQLPCLTLLRIGHCLEMEELISDQVGNSNCISSFSIQSLILHDMLSLNRIANRPFHFPCLEYMRVINCPELKKLPFGAEILKNRLKVIQGDDYYWWDNLDWDDESTKVSLTPYFRYDLA